MPLHKKFPYLRILVYGVIILLAVMFIFLGNITDTETSKPYQVLPAATSVRFTTSTESRHVEYKIMSGAKGDRYRISYRIQTEYNGLRATDLYSIAKDSATISTQLISPSGNTLSLKDISLKPYDPIQYIEEVVTLDDNYTDVEFQIPDSYALTVTDLKATRITTAATTATLFQSLGKTNIPTQQLSSAIYSAGESVDMVGPVFQATQDKLLNATLNMDFVGNGGNGTYVVELRPVQYLDGRYTLVDTIISQTIFTASTAEDVYGIGGKTYLFPLSSRLVKGQYYAIVINSQNTKKNSLHNFELMGTVEQGDNMLPIMAGSSGGVLKNVGYGIANLTYLPETENDLLYGAMVESTDANKAYYHYSLQYNPIDLIDATSSSCDVSVSGHNFFNNGELNAWSEPIDNAGFCYDNQMPYPFSSATIVASQIDPNNRITSRIYYSVDNGQSWTEIPTLTSNNDRIDYRYTIKGDGISQRILIKVGYNESQVNTKKINLFGLSVLEVNAILNP